MSQTEFGMIIMTSLVVICSGIAPGSVGLKSRPGAKNIGFFPVIDNMKAPNPGRFFISWVLTFIFPCPSLPRELLTLSANLPSSHDLKDYDTDFRVDRTQDRTSFR